MAHPITLVKNFTYDLLNRELEMFPGKDDKERKLTRGEFEKLLKAYNNDFWQNGQGSLMPPPKGRGSSTIQAQFQRRFVFRNVIRECVERVSGAFYGKSPDWGINRPFEGAQATSEVKKTPIEKALGEFWTRENAATVLADAFESRLVTGRGGVRIYLPTKYKKQPGQQDQPEQSAADQATPEEQTGIEQPVVAFKSIDEALKAIRIEHVSPERAKLLDDDGEIFGMVKYARRDNWEMAVSQSVIEFSFVDDDNLTFIGLIRENTGKSGTILDNAERSDGMELGGSTTYNEFKGKPYVTDGLYKNNQLLNLALTCSGFSLVDNGFGEVFFTNVEVEMETVEDPTADGGTRDVPKNIKRGGGTVQNLIGITNVDSDGGETRLTPGVTFREPSALTAFKDGKDMAYRSCLEEANQLYALISGDAAASGESRIQAMTDFWLRIRKYKPEVDQMGTWLLTTVLRFAAAVSGGTGVSADDVVTYDSKVFIGQVSNEEKTTIIQMRDDGIISGETASVLLGVEDPAIEAELITAERKLDPMEISPAVLEKKLEVALQMQGIFSQEYILEYLGVSDQTKRTTIMNQLATEAGFGATLPEDQLQLDGGTGQPTDQAATAAGQ